MKKYISGVIFRKDHIEGSEIPLFYLPVLRPQNRDAIELWTLPLAPFVVFYKIIRGAMYSIWWDLNEWLYQIEVLNKKKSINPPETK